VYLHRVHPRLAIGCIVSALALVVAVFPRRDKFDAPGPRLDEASQRKLFTMLRSVADATKQDMPAEVFLVSDVNAWVSNRGGTMGFGSRRVMGLGLPLLQGLTVSEFKAVIAHEFGHYAAGDVGLGPWIYKTRAAIARVMSSLGDSWVSVIFNAYGNLFMRLTLAISRQQDFSPTHWPHASFTRRSWRRRCAGLADCLRHLPRTGKAKCRRPLKPGICRRSRPVSISSSGRNASRRR
jgi:hypothetical protein